MISFNQGFYGKDKADQAPAKYWPLEKYLYLAKSLWLSLFVNPQNILGLNIMLVLAAMVLSVLFTFPFSAPLSRWQRNPCTNKCRNVNKIRQRDRIFQRIEEVFTSLATSLHFKSVFVLQMWSRDNIENMSWKLLLLSNALLKIVEMSCWEKT